MKLKRIAVLFMALSVVFGSHFGVAEENGYHSYSELTATLTQLEKSNADLTALQSIGKTGENRDIWLFRIANEKNGHPDKKSALFLAGNLEGDHLIGSEAILATIQYLLNNYGKDEKVAHLIDHCTCYFVPRVNVDGAEKYFAKVKGEVYVNSTPTDEDNDGLIDEDPAEDLNGDGFISQMRVKDPSGEYFPDPKEVRLLKKADVARGEKGIFKIYTEGIDNDKDGAYNEDPIGGVNIDRNFPHNYPYFEKDAGLYMTSEPETRAVLDFLFNHPNVTIILTYSVFDNLVNPPKPERERPGQAEESGTDMRRMYFRPRQAAKAVDKDDIPYFEEMSKQYKEMTGIKSFDVEEKPRGAFYEWGYFQYGVLSLTTPVWQVAEMTAKEDSGKNARRVPMRPQREKKDEETSEAKLLKWFNQKNIKGFIDWQKYQHPELGEVEIGGFVPYKKINPPAEEFAGLFENHAKFVVALGDYFPELGVSEIKVTKKANEIFQIDVTLQNQGYLPTALAQGVRARAVKPVLTKLAGDNFEILAGNKLNFLDSLAGNGSAQKYSWIVKAKNGSTVKLVVTSEKAGNITKEIILK